MSDQQQVPPSTIAPSDSVSTGGKKKNKPGKRERAEKRSAAGGSGGQPASASKASFFASGSSAPVPQPGKFPVVFQTGAGEPSRDDTFEPDLFLVGETLNEFPDRYVDNPKFAEFSAHTETDFQEFQRELVYPALLRLAQQIVHSHVNMGLPQGDYSPLASTDVRVPPAVSAYLGQFGEFAVPDLGTRFLLTDYHATIRHLVYMADEVRGGRSAGLFERHWVPLAPNDGYTKAIVADALDQLPGLEELDLSRSALEDAVLSGSVPDFWEDIKTAIDDPPGREGEANIEDRFDFLFTTRGTAGQVYTGLTDSDDKLAALGELGLQWPNHDAGHLDWLFNVKERFTALADRWAKRAAAYSQFFELSSGLPHRTVANGTMAQWAHVKTTDSVTVVKTYLALSAAEFSLAACFPPTSVFRRKVARNVVVTTPLSVAQRGTEFCQLDWR